jgi:GTP-binding protein Era
MKKKAFRSGFVGIVGRPNVGKSTLMNHLIGQKIAITSAKPQTTRSQIRTVYTCDRGQIIFLDTPGIHKAENKLGEYMDDVAYETLSQVDVILWLVEPTNFSGAGERFIASKLPPRPLTAWRISSRARSISLREPSISLPTKLRNSDSS